MQPAARTGGPHERRCEEKHDGLNRLLEVQPPEDVAQPALAEAEDHRHRDVQLRIPAVERADAMLLAVARTGSCCAFRSRDCSAERVEHSGGLTGAVGYDSLTNGYSILSARAAALCALLHWHCGSAHCDWRAVRGSREIINRFTLSSDALSVERNCAFTLLLRHRSDNTIR
jgi:hypothetical protein